MPHRLDALHRPRILIAAARHAQHALAPRPGCAGRELDRLLEEESRLEHGRRTGAPGYRPDAHVAVLAAVLAQAALEPPETPAPQEKASGSASLRLAM